MNSSAVDDEGDPSVVRISRQWSAVVLDHMVASRKDCGPMDDMVVLEPLEHSVLGAPLEGGVTLLPDLYYGMPLALLCLKY